MKNRGSFIPSCVLVIAVLIVSSAAQSKSSKYACSEPNPASLCTAANTCGSASAPCSVDVKRTANSASSTPGIAGAKGNSTFCVKAGTKVTFQSSAKHLGFLLDFGDPAPFAETDDITGGSSKPVTVTAKTPGCYKYSVGACASGAIYGMCKDASAEMIVTP